MGIGITYYGSGGRKRHVEAESMDDVMAAEARFGGGRRERVSAKDLFGTEDRGKVAAEEGEEPKYLSQQIMPGSGLAFGKNGLCLAGEENGADVGGCRMFGTKADGTKGFLGLDDIDPLGEYSTVEKHEDGSPAEGGWQAGGDKGRQVDYVTHLALNQSDQKLYELYVTVTFSPNGRAVAVSEEKRRVISDTVNADTGNGAMPTGGEE